MGVLDFERVLEPLFDFLATVSGILLLVLAVINSYAVCLRYLFNSPIDWSLSVSSFLMISAVFLSGAYTLRVDGHVFVNLFLMKLSPKARNYFLLLRYAVVFVFMSILTWHGWFLAWDNLSSVAESIDRLPLFPGYIMIPLGGVLLCVYSVLQIVKVAGSILK